jgi:hypothetical protein
LSEEFRKDNFPAYDSTELCAIHLEKRKFLARDLKALLPLRYNETGPRDDLLKWDVFAEGDEMNLEVLAEDLPSGKE